MKARGFNDLSDSEVNQLVNDACVELDSMYPWPYREKSVTGTPAPLAIPDLGRVWAVMDADRQVPLDRAAPDELMAFYGDLSAAGAPRYWYRATPDGVVQIATYPTSTATIGVEYQRTSPVLVLDADVPLCPVAWRAVIVDIAAASAYPDGETPPGLQARIDRRVGLMVSEQFADYGPSEVALDGVDS